MNKWFLELREAKMAAGIIKNGPQLPDRMWAGQDALAPAVGLRLCA